MNKWYLNLNLCLNLCIMEYLFIQKSCNFEEMTEKYEHN